MDRMAKAALLILWFAIVIPIGFTQVSQPTNDTRPVVFRMTAKWCEPCKGVKKLLTKDVLAKQPFQIIEWDVDKLGWKGLDEVDDFTIPAFWWKAPKGEMYAKWATIEDLAERWKFSKQIK